MQSRRPLSGPRAPVALLRPPRLPVLTGFEGTQMFGHGTDVLDTSEHALRFREDLRLLGRDGIGTFRACIPWHKVEREPGRFDWAWTDAYLGEARALGLRPILDPLHHTSFPAWLSPGFAHPDLPARYAAFLEALARRHPWATDYTVVNEPFATAVLCGFTGDWHPHWTGLDGLVPVILGMARTIREGTARLSGALPGLRVIHVDSCERHQALDAPSRPHVDLFNDLRFAVLDLVLGRVDRHHPLWGLLTAKGLSEDEAQRFRDAPSQVDVLGLDYYAHSEMGWTRRGRSERILPLGFARVAGEYADRYDLPLMLSETNLRGRVEDRLSWLRYMAGECEDLAARLALRGRAFEGLCWYPFVDSTDWCSLVREPRRRIDPQGIYYLSDVFDRHGSELSERFAALARGEARAADLPAYRFEDVVLDRRGVRKFLPLMARWAWKEGEPSGRPRSRAGR